MIHILHHQYDEIVDVLTNKGDKKILGDLHEFNIDGLNTHQFTTLATTSAGQYLEKRARYLIPAEEENYYHEFIVMEAITRQDEKNVYSKGSYHDINTQNIVAPATYNSWSLEQFVRHALTNTEWKIGTVEFVGIRSATFDNYLGAYDFLIEIRKLFNYEFEMRFRVEVESNRIVGRYIDLVEQLGRDTGKEIVYAKDLVGIEKRVYNERIVTQLIAISQKRQDGTRLQVTVADQEAFQRWNRNGYHITGIYEPTVEDVEKLTVAQLETMAEAELQTRIDSVVEYNVDAVTIEQLMPHESVRLGDRIRVKDPEFSPPLYAEARVIHVTRSLIDDTQKTYTIGEVVEYDTEDLFKTFQQLQQTYGLRVVKSATPPAGSAQIVWIDTSQTPNVPHSWNGTAWVKFAPTIATEIGAETPQGAEDKAAAAAGAALDTATTIAQQEAAAAQQNAIDTAAIDASTKAGAALDSATTIAQQEAATAEQNAINTAATDATNKANTAQNNAQTYADQQDTALANSLRSEFQTYVEETGTTIVQSATAPTNPATNDLWIDISVTPHIWRRWNGTAWVNATATALSELGGVLSQNQLAIDSINAQHLAPGSVLAEAIGNAQIIAEKLAAGAVGTTAIADGAVTNVKVANLDAAKITTGLLSAARVQIGSSTTFATNYDPSTKETPAGAQNKADAAAAAAVQPINERLILWQYADTTYIDGGNIYTDTITANQIAAGAITANELGANAVIAGKIAANAVTAATIAAGAVTANAIAANSISSNMIATVGLDAGVIKFGTMSGDRIAANTIDANRLKAGTVIAQDITFTGTLQGANGTFSGELNGVMGSFERLFVTEASGTLLIDIQPYFITLQDIMTAYGAPKTSILPNTIQLTSEKSDPNIEDASHVELYAAPGVGLNVTAGLNSLGKFTAQQEAEFLAATFFNGASVEINPTGRIYVPQRGNGDMLIERKTYLGQELIQNGQETGFCGVGGTTGGSATVAGVGVNFRNRKSYAPSSITLNMFSGNAASVAAIDITSNGFWFYISKSTQASGTYLFWRGTYTA